jgi:XTP/dITP diphosphohydrolase
MDVSRGLLNWRSIRLDRDTPIIAATKNLDKFKEIETLWGSFAPSVVIAGEFYPDVDELGETYEENAVTKATTLAQILGGPALADDSGIEVEAMGWGPGVRSARTPRVGAPSPERNANVLQAVQNANRAALFVSVCVLVVPGYEPVIARGEVDGLIAQRSLGNKGFGYDPIFWYPPFEATFGQVEAARKHAVSHRGRAVRALKTMLQPLVR